MDERKRSQMEREVDRELIAKGIKAQEDFDKTQTLHVPARRRESKLISIRLSIEMMKDLRTVAERKGLPGYQGLIKTYVQKGLDGERTSAPAAAGLWVAEGSGPDVLPTTTGQLSASYWPTEVSPYAPIKEESLGGNYR